MRTRVAVFSGQAKRAIALAMGALLVMGGLLGILTSQGLLSAFAATTTLENRGSVGYAGYETSYFVADGQMAYCANPSKASPAEGTYTKDAIAPLSDSGAVEVVNVLWFGYGGPGFDYGVAQGWWPSTWYDGSAMTDQDYIALTHIIVSDVYAEDFSASTYGTSAEFKNWLSDNVTRYDWRTGELNDDRTQARLMWADGVPSDFAGYCFQLNTGPGTQVIVGHSYYDKKGNLDVEKKRGPSHSYQDLSGAVFELRSGDAAVASATTDAAGKAHFADIDEGNYTLVEVTAPDGFLRAGDKAVSVPAGDTATYEVAEESVMGGIIVAKQDKDGMFAPQGNGQLKDAEFTVYAKQKVVIDGVNYAAGAAVATMKAKWDDDYDAYTAKTGATALPVGTYTIKETKAPSGYKVDASFKPDVTISKNGELHGYKQQGFANDQLTANEEVERGNIKLNKADSKRANGEAQGDATLAGAVYDVINDSANAVESPQYKKSNGKPKLIAKGEVVCKIVTNADGIATTNNSTANGWEMPEDWGGKALAVGSYKVVESKAPEGYEIDATWEKSAAIQDDGDTAEVNATDKVKTFGLAVAKYDAETGKSLPQGDADMDGAVFSVTNSSDKPIALGKGDDAVECAVGEVVMTITAHYDGGYGRYVAKTSANALPYGTYTVKEQTAPKGYKNNSRWSQVVVFDESTAAGTIVDCTMYEKSVPDTVVRGNLKLVKVDDETTTEQGDAVRKGAVYDVVNGGSNPVLSPQYKDGGKQREIAPGGVVCQIVTDADGNAATNRADLNGWSAPASWGGKTLAYGTYYVKENTPPVGYSKNADWRGEATVSNDEVEPQVEVTAPDPVKRYGLAVAKYDRDTAKSIPQGDAKLEGARFSVTNSSAAPVKVGGRTYAAGSVVMEISSQWDEASQRFVAKTAADALPFGTYIVKEIASPEGYLLDGASQAWSSTYTLHGTEGTIDEHVLFSDAVSDGVKRGNISLEKDDAQRANGNRQGDADLSGAVYDIVNRSKNAVRSPQFGTDVAPGGVVCRIVTDAEGKASTTRPDLNGWTIPSEWGGKALPYGTYEIVESSSSTGYNVNATWKGVAVIRQDGETKALATTEDVQRGGLKVGKVSRENGVYHEQGSASLEEWTFEIVNKSAEPVILGRGATGPEVKPGEVVTTIATRKVGNKYIAQTAVDALPYGTYEVHEIQTMRPQDNGYLFDAASKAWSKTFTIRSEGQIVEFTDEANAESNLVVRGDFSFNKKLFPSMRPLANIPFKVTSVTTGEWHVVVTDDNGEVDTSSDNYRHSHKTNESDKAIRSNGTVDESKLNYEAGVWFSGSKTVPVPVDDDRGALVFDTYEVEELRCSKNADYTLVSFEVTVRREGKAIDLGTVDDAQDVGPQVTTTLTDYEGGKVVAAKSTATLTDTVTFNNLEKGETYRLTAKLYQVSGGQLGQQVSENTVEFKPATTHGAKEVDLELDTTGMEGVSLVCFEYLYKSSGALIASHEEPDDEGQTVRVPVIGTTLTDDATQSHYAASTTEGVISLTDTVAYENLTPHKTYTVKGKLIDKETGKVVMDADGREVTAERTFTPSAAAGSVEVPFTFKDPGLAGRAVVAFESVEYRGVEYAVHADIADADQTVYIPEIATTFTDAASGTHAVSAMGKVALTDTVAYKNIQPGVEHTMNATLMDKSTGEPALDKEGNPVTTSVTFTPNASEGSVDVMFTVDSGILPATTVCFERLYVGGALVAVHADIDDDGQTIYVPAIATTFAEKASGYHSTTSMDEIELVDTVAYEGLEPGRAYTMKATLVDKESGETLRDSKGNAYEAEVSFAPEKRTGQVEVPFTVAFDDLAPATVCFERLCAATGTVAAEHAELDDEGQTVYAPKIATTATDRGTGSQVASIGGLLQLVDIVSYEGLEPGGEYELRGSVHVRDENGSDEGVLTDSNGHDVVATATLVPEERNGRATMTFSADVEGIDGKTLVVFEDLMATLADGDEASIVAKHADISDEGQTVYVPKIATTATDKESGTHYAASTGTITIEDVVEYENLVPGLAYTMEGVLHGVASDGADSGVLLGVDGAEMKSRQTFTPEAKSGSVTISFQVDPAITPARLVVFENLVVSVSDGVGEDGNESTHTELVATHEDISDEGQSVSIAEVATTATDESTGEHVASIDGKLELDDAVAYEGLEPGARYKLAGVVHVRDAAGRDAGALKDVSGKEVRSETELTPEASAGTTHVKFAASAALNPGEGLVVFETLSDATGRIVAEHADIADAGQTVEVARIATTATERESGSHYAGAMKPYTVVDSVVYEGLVPGVQYVMTGTLHAVDGAGEDLGAVVNGAGDVMTATLEFTPHEASGSVAIEFEVDPAWMPARAVVFEKLGLAVEGEAVPVASHENPADEDQTVRTAKIETTLADAETGNHVVLGAGITKLTDTVAYEGLEPGVPYRLDAKLMDKATGVVLHDAEDGAVTASVEFTPTASNGVAVVPFEMNAEQLAAETVCFERLSKSDGTVIAVHEDLGDEGQTITVPKIATTAIDPRTGAHVVATSDELVIEDVVEYENLTPGEPYVLTGTIHVRDEKGSDAGVLKGADGNAVSASKVFTAEASSGSEKLEFKADSKLEPGMTLVVFEVVEARDIGKVAEHADIADEGQSVQVPGIATTATEKESGGHFANSLEAFTVVDTVSYENLEPGIEYTVVGTLHAVDEGGADMGPIMNAKGELVSTTKTFVPKAPNGSVALEFRLDPKWAPSRAVAFEQLGVKADGKFVPVAAHENPEDENQTVRVAKVSTTLIEEASQSHVASRIGKNKLIDTVSYEGLQPDKKYVMTATLVDKATGKQLKRSDGEVLGATKVFTPKSASGTVDVPIAVETEQLAAETVCFERLSRIDGTLVAAHEDAYDEAQTIRVPSVRTTATDPRTGGHTVADSDELAVQDIVAYENLEIGVEYKLIGTVHVRNDKGEDAGELKDTKGNPITAEKTFTPKKASGQVGLAITGKVDALNGKTLVVFEDLVNMKAGTVAARHANIEDKGQTVRLPEIATTATEKESGSHYVPSTAPFTVVDRVVYENLEPNVEYVMYGTLHAVDEKGADAGIVRDADGKELAVKRLFTPKKASGCVDIEFECDPSWMPERAVAFEECGVVVNGVFVPVAKHENPQDENQTVRMPRISTTAVDKATREHIGHGGGPATVIDRIDFEGLQPGKKYTVSGVLMDKSTAKPFVIDGAEIVSEMSFTPDAARGSIDVEFAMSGNVPNNLDLVVFERLSVDGRIVAVHEDIEDNSQTVSYRQPGIDETLKKAGDVFDKTGYWFARWWWIIALIGATMLLLGAIRYMANDASSPFNQDDDEPESRMIE